jgi:hypothetical protein
MFLRNAQDTLITAAGATRCAHKLYGMSGLPNLIHAAPSVQYMMSKPLNRISLASASGVRLAAVVAMAAMVTAIATTAILVHIAWTASCNRRPAAQKLTR